MGSRNLPENVDSAYADDGTHPDVKLHQQHHDVIHDFVNLFDDAAPGDGFIPFFNTSTGLWEYIDPEIAGSPGPTGATGRGFIFTGPWDSGTTYHIYSDNSPPAYEIATYLGNVYVAQLTHSNSAPTVDGNGQGTASANWGVVAVRGVNGLAGADGQPGQDGMSVTGPPGPPGPASESVEFITDSGAAQTLDLADSSFYVITLTDDCVITLIDTLGRSASAVTLHLIQGPGGPHTMTITNTVTWFAENGDPPTLGVVEGNVDLVSLWQLAGSWFGSYPLFGGETPPVTYDPLAMDVLAAYSDSSNQTTDYTSAANYQVGNDRVAHAFVVNTRTSNDPVIPTLSGAGASGWDQGATRIDGAGTSRRRLTEFIAQDASAGAAAPLVVGVGGVDHDGVAVVVIRTNPQPSTAKALAVGTSVSNGGGSNAPNLTLGAASDAANRPIVGVLRNAQAATFTEDSGGGWVILQTQDMSNPTLRMHVLWNTSSFDTTFTASLSASNTWVAIGSEMEQG